MKTLAQYLNREVDEVKNEEFFSKVASQHPSLVQFAEDVMDGMELYPAPVTLDDAGAPFLKESASTSPDYKDPYSVKALWQEWSLLTKQAQEGYDKQSLAETGMDNQDLYDLLSGVIDVSYPPEPIEKQAAEQGSSETGAEAIMEALSNLNMDALERGAKADLKSGKKTKRPRAVAILNMLEGMKRNKLTPSDFMISGAPVIPAKNRPFSAMGSTFIPGDANVLYKDLFDVLDAYKEERDVLGDDAAGQSELSVYDALKSVFGYGEAVKEKTRQKDVKGFLQKVVGGTAKYGYYNRKLLSKPQDNVGRSTIIVDPDLTMDQLGLPVPMAFKMFAPYIQRQLVQKGMKPAQALRAVRDQDKVARVALDRIIDEKQKPVMYSRSPAWHRFSVLGAWPVLREGNAIAISPLTTTGLNADFDGDQQIGRVLCYMPEGIEKTCLHSLRPDVVSWQYKINDMFTDTKTSIQKDGGALVAVDLENFPHTTLANTRKDDNYDIEFYNVPEGVRVPTYDEKTGSVILAPVAFWSVHKGKQVEIVTLSDGSQIYTDDDPRAIYGVSSKGDCSLERFTPTQAQEDGVLVPVRNGFKIETNSAPVFFDFNTCTLSSESRGDLCVLADFKFGQFIGMIAGDGWVDAEKYGYLLHLSDKECHNARFIEDYLKTYLSDNVTVRSVPHLKSKNPSCYGDTVAHTFYNLDSKIGAGVKYLVGGERDALTSGAANKRFPFNFEEFPDEFLIGMVNGLIATDGSVSVSRAKGKPQLMISFSSTSLRLCRELRMVLKRLEVGSSVGFSKMTKSDNALWNVSISTTDAKRQNILSRCAFHRKRDTFLSTDVSDAPEHAREDYVPFPKAVYEVLMSVVESPNVGADYKKKFTGTEEEWEARLALASLSQSLWQKRNKGVVTRFVARSAVSHVSGLMEERRQVLESAKGVVDNLSNSFAEKSTKSASLSKEEWGTLIKGVDAVVSPKEVKSDASKRATVGKLKTLINSAGRLGRMSRFIFSKCLEFFDSFTEPSKGETGVVYERWKTIVISDVKWLPIVSIEKTGQQVTGYDLTVPDYETFMSTDGVILSNTMNVHVPATREAMDETIQKLMPSREPFSAAKADSIVPLPKQEQIWGLYTANTGAAKRVHTFKTEQEAMAAINKGIISPSDEVEIQDGIEGMSKSAEVKVEEPVKYEGRTRSTKGRFTSPVRKNPEPKPEPTDTKPGEKDESSGEEPSVPS